MGINLCSMLTSNHAMSRHTYRSWIKLISMQNTCSGLPSNPHSAYWLLHHSILYANTSLSRRQRFGWCQFSCCLELTQYCITIKMHSYIFYVLWYHSIIHAVNRLCNYNNKYCVQAIFSKTLDLKNNSIYAVCFI